MGPTEPVVPAALSVWQPPQPALANTAAPETCGLDPPPEPLLAGAAVDFFAPIRLGPAKKQHDHERRGDPADDHQAAVEDPQHQGEGKPKWSMYQSPESSQTYTSSTNTSPPARGRALPGRPRERTISTLAANAP